MLKLMEPMERVETDSLVDMHVAVTEGEEQYVEAVGELHEDGLDGQSGDGMLPEAEGGHNRPPPGTLLVWTRTTSRSLGTAKSPILLDPLRAPYWDSWKLAPRKPSRIRSPRLRFPRNLCL